MLNHGVTFNLCSAKMCSSAIFETYFSYHIDTWIAVAYYYLPPADRPGTGDYKMPSVRACVRPFVTFLQKPFYL